MVTDLVASEVSMGWISPPDSIKLSKTADAINREYPRLREKSYPVRTIFDYYIMLIKNLNMLLKKFISLGYSYHGLIVSPDPKHTK